MTIRFGREVCGRYASAVEREWLVTNGIGGYAAGTLAGTLSRRYHGLLIAALKPPVARTLLVAKLDETVRYRGIDYPIHTNAWASGAVEPNGYFHIEEFRLDGSIPTWTFALADALVEKQVWMEQGENTTYIRYSLLRGTAPIVLSVRALANYRDSHGNNAGDGDAYKVEIVRRGLKIAPPGDAEPYYLLSDHAEASPAFDWYRDFLMEIETERGLPDTDNHAHIGNFSAALAVGESVTFAATTETHDSIDGKQALADAQAYDARLIASANLGDAPDWVAQLTLAADQLIVKRPLQDVPNGKTVIAGYHWFTDWGRDTMIALPGLTLATHRYDDAATILRTFARFVDQGMLPNTFPDAGETPFYNTVDATLWYFEAIRAYHEATGDDTIVRDLFPVLKDIITWHEQGTRYGIRVDSADGLLASGQADIQLTWMDVKIGDWVVTPRTGKAVEINALWYNALCIMADFAQLLRVNAAPYASAAERAAKSFYRFWNADAGYLYDVIDIPDGSVDATMRPNAIFAASLHYSPLDDEQAKSVVDECAAALLTSFGLRSLSPSETAYSGMYIGDRRARDAVYHQGPVWAWLIGAFVEAHLRVYGDKKTARRFIEPSADHLNDGLLGSIAEIFDGDPPHTPRGAAAQAWSVAEVLRVWRLTE